MNLLILAVGVTGVIDLRRLNTPGGAALAWAQAATFGDCGRYLELSVSPDDLRPRDEICGRLKDRTAPNLARQSVIDVRLVDSGPGRATVDLERPEGKVRAILDLVRTDRWRVVRNKAACDTIGCA